MPAENRDRSQAVRELQIRSFWFAHGHNVTTTNVTRYRRLPKRCTFAAPSRPLSTLEPRKLAGEWRRQSDTQRRRSDTLARYTGTVQNCANVDGIRGCRRNWWNTEISNLRVFNTPDCFTSPRLHHNLPFPHLYGDACRRTIQP